MSLDVGWKTDRGLNPDRPENEDVCGATRRKNPKGNITVAVVADGLGGMQRGRAASEAAASSLLRADHTPSFPTRAAFADWFHQEMDLANAAVTSVLGRSSGGTTCTAVAILGGVLVLTHVGDTRAYLANGNEIRRLTTDHSLAEALAAAGQGSPDDHKAQRSSLLRSLGSHAAMPERYVDDLATLGAVGTEKWTHFLPGETLLICSDGVWDVVEPEAISKAMTAERRAQAIANWLVAEALRNGGPDNASALVIRNVPREGEGAKTRTWPPPKPARPLVKEHTALPASLASTSTARPGTPATAILGTSAVADQQTAWPTQTTTTGAAPSALSERTWQVLVPLAVGLLVAAIVFGLFTLALR